MSQHPMTLEYAEWLAAALVERITPFVKRVEVAGSVRRKKALVGDIEIVCEPYLNGDLFAKDSTPILDPLRLALAKVGTLKKNGDRYIRVHLTKTDQYADIFVVWPPAQWGSILAIRTGPADLGKHCMRAFRDRRVLHLHGHAVNMIDGEVLDTSTEEAYFRLAGIEHVAPEERDSLMTRLATN